MMTDELAFPQAAELGQLLDGETAAFVSMRTSEIKALVKRSAQDIVEIGQKLLEVKGRLPHGRFGPWLEAEFGWQERMARNFMRVADRFKSANFADLAIAPSALYLLASPSTPDAAVEEAFTLAASGERVTYSAARGLVASHKAAEEADPFPIFRCRDCGEIFYSEVWHCPYCDHHWHDRSQCANCHHDKPSYSEGLAIRELRATAVDLFEDVLSFKKNIPWARRVLAERQSQERARERQAPAFAAPSSELIRLMVGDALELELPDESVDVIITSPPYNLGDDEEWPMGGFGREAREGIGYDDRMDDEAYQEWQLAVLDELYRVARPGASLFYNHKTRTRSGVLLHPMAWISQVKGWTLRQEIVWDREVTHNHSATLFWPVDERIYWLTKGKPLLYGGSIGMSSVWRFHGPQPYTWHPAPFAEELPRRCLQAIGGQGLVVLDPFAGSCTTVKVAAEMGHEAIGVDRRGDYLDRAKVEYGW